MCLSERVGGMVLGDIIKLNQDHELFGQPPAVDNLPRAIVASCRWVLRESRLAELHAQSGTALKAMADQREALRAEADAHRRTQEQLLALHETMQKERDAFALEMAGDRDARAQLPIVLAELASTRSLLDQMGREAAEKILAQAKADGGGGGDAGAASASSGRSPKSRASPKMTAYSGGWLVR